MRDALFTFALLLVLVIFGVMAWATQHPLDDRITAVRGWPLVGDLVGRFQEAYRPVSIEPDGASEASRMGDERLQSLVVNEVRGARPSVWVAPETRLKAQPRESSTTLLTFDRYANFDELEARPPWFRVEADGREGWVRVDETGDGTPPLGREAEKPLPLDPLPPSAERLAEASTFFTGTPVVTKVGPYALHTDVDNAFLLRRLERVATQLDTVYTRMFGRTPRGTPEAAVVLYGSREAYRGFQSKFAALRGLHAAGHAVPGLAAMWGGGDIEAVTSTFVHELTHLINRRALGPALPPWLDEGIAEAMASLAVGADGVVDVEGWSGHRFAVGRRVTTTGGRANLFALRSALGRGTLPTLETVLALDWSHFVRGDAQGAHYAISGAFLRFLAEEDVGHTARREALLGFLDDVARGEPPDGQLLLARLGESELLDTAFRAWIEASLDD